MIKISEKIQKSRIQSQLIVYSVIFALVIVAAVAYFAYTQAASSLRSTVEDKLDTVAELKVDFLNEWVDEQQRNAVFLASLPELRMLSGILLNPESRAVDRDHAHAELTALVTLIAQRATDFQDVQIIDQAGVIVVSAASANVGRSQFGQPFFAEGLTRTYIQRFYDSDLFGRTTLTVGTPLFDDQNKRVGVLALHFNLHHADSIIREDQDLNEPIQSYLISRSREILTDDPIVLGQYPELASLAIDSAIEGGAGTGAYISHTGAAVIGRYLWIENQNAALIVEINEQTALGPARRLAINIIIAGLILSVILVFIVVILARRITAPLLALTETVARISAGDLDASAPVLSNDEVGTLAQAFNAMTTQLRQTLAGLQQELLERRQAEYELLQFRKVMDESSDAIFLIDPHDGHYVDSNRYAYEWLGYNREELGRLTIMDVAQHITSLDVWHERVRLVQDQGRLIFETIYRRKAGNLFPVEVSARMLDYGERKVILALARDITERKQSEDALLQSEERFRKIFQSSPIAICITALEDGRLLDANYAYWDITGYDPNHSIERNADDMKMWDFPVERLAFVKKLRDKGSLFNPDDYLHHTDGSLRQVISFYELIQIGNEDCVLSMFYDMSAQKATLQALQQSVARTRALLAAVPDLIFEFSMDGTFLNSVQPVVGALLMPPDEFIGRNVSEVMPADIANKTLAAVESAIKNERLEAFEYQLQINSSPYEYEARIVASGPDSALAIVRDITQRKWVESERERFINELEIKNRESETLRESLASVVGTFEFEEIIRHILDQIQRVVPYDTASVWRVEGNRQFIIGGVNLPPEILIPGTILTVNENNSAYPILNGTEPYILNNNVQEELGDFQQEPHTYVQSWLAIPLKTRGQVIGIIALDGRNKDQFTGHHADLAVSFANQVAVALKNADLFSELQNELVMREDLIKKLEEKNAEAETMRESLASIVGTFELSEIVERILDQIRRVVPYDSASVWRLDSNIQKLIGSRGLEPELSAVGLELDLNEDNHAMPLFLGDLPYLVSHNVQSEFPSFRVPPHTYINSWLGVPLKARGRIIGLIALDGRQKNQFNEHHAQLAVTFADQVAIALENARLFAELQDELKKQIALRSASTSISSSLHLDQVLGEICKQMCIILDGTSAYIANYDKNNEAYTVVAEYMSSTANVNELVSDLGLTYSRKDGAWLFNGATGLDFEVMHAGAQDLPPWTGQIMSKYGGKTILFIPLYVQGRLLGHAELWDSRSLREFTRDEISFCRAISQQAAIAIANANLFEQLQRELLERKSLILELESKNAELERFTYTVSHDLKSPLFTIRGFLGYLEQDMLAGKQERVQADVKRITDATEKMQGLLNDLLELSRVGRLKNEPVMIPFDDLAREAIELVQGRIMERGVAVHIEPNLPAVIGDKPRLLEVLQNLVDNAAKFMGDQKTPRVEIGVNGEENGKPVFYVRDNGIGILPEHFERVFGLFNKLDAKSEGTGIGLALVRRIIEVHGGRIWLESGAGMGSTFYFTLPASPGAKSQET